MGEGREEMVRFGGVGGSRACPAGALGGEMIVCAVFIATASDALRLCICWGSLVSWVRKSQIFEVMPMYAYPSWLRQ